MYRCIPSFVCLCKLYLCAYINMYIRNDDLKGTKYARSIRMFRFVNTIPLAQKLAALGVLKYPNSTLSLNM